MNNPRHHVNYFHGLFVANLSSASISELGAKLDSFLVQCSIIPANNPVLLTQLMLVNHRFDRPCYGLNDLFLVRHSAFYILFERVQFSIKLLRNGLKSADFALQFLRLGYSQLAFPLDILQQVRFSLLEPLICILMTIPRDLFETLMNTFI